MVFFLFGFAGCDCGGNPGGNGSDAGIDGGGCATACTDGEVCRYDTCVPNPEPCTTDVDCVADTYCDETTMECLPWGVGPGGNNDATCTQEVVPGVFFPDVQCEWLGGSDPCADDTSVPYPCHRNVLGSPMVADFGLGDQELLRPSIAFISYNGNDGGGESCRGDSDATYFGVIRVVSGRGCELQATIDSPHPLASSALALADLTGDGKPEIIAATVGGGLAAWRRVGQSFELLWRARQADDVTLSTFGMGVCQWGGPSVYDLDDDGVPEVMLGGAVFDATGKEITTTLGMLDVGTGSFPVVADVDADGQPELVTGLGVYGWETLIDNWSLEVSLGAAQAHIAVGDFGTFGADPAQDDRTTLDGIAEVVTVYAGVLTIWSINAARPADQRDIVALALPGGGSGGPPTIADFDGDGRAEAASAGLAYYSVFDLDCVAGADPSVCPTLSTTQVLWSKQSQDASSNVTGSSVFDFEGDGIAEAVYGDECFTRVYDGRNGDVVYSRYRTSCTWHENPIIADVDADFGAEIVITSNTNCGTSCSTPVDPIFDGIRCNDEADCPGTTTCLKDTPADPLGRCRCTMDEDCGGDGFVCLPPTLPATGAAGNVCKAAHPGAGAARGIRVIGDQLGRWVATRPIWNQHAYSVTHISDTGRVTRTSQWARNWDVPGLNNFRQNSPGEGAGAGLMPDLTIKRGKFNCTGADADLSMEVCNRGTEPVADGLAVSAYDGTTLLCTATTQAPLYPGDCETVYCTWTGASGPVDVTATVDDSGTGTGAHTECREDNNRVTIPAVTCP
ncbi:MAG TPA: hypothetical protein VL172_03670 [Kofleriaceae bacterium]|nr:hypothetical protein [Kofleriaceae bacterium]